MKILSKKYPKLVRLHEIGKTEFNNKLIVLEVGNQIN